MTLDIWPELPIVIYVDDPLPSVTNLISVINQRDRVCKVVFVCVQNSFWKEVATTMSEPFPALIELKLAASLERRPLILLDSFLGGSAPRLRSLDLCGIPFPEIGKLLLSTRGLVNLSLDLIPPPRYISPDAISSILSPLTRLESLDLRFKVPFSTHGASQRPPALAPVVLPALTNFSLYGRSGFLEDIVSRIEAPLDCIAVTFSDETAISDIPLLRDFIYRTELLNAPHRAEIFFSDFNSRVSLFQRNGDVDFKVLSLAIPRFDYTFFSSQISSLAQVCRSLLPPLPSLEHLGIYKYRSCDLFTTRHREVDTTLWMELLHLFITVKDLVLDEPLVLPVAQTLQELVGEQGTEILPALQNIFIEGCQSSGPVPEGIAKFIAARERSGRPVKCVPPRSEAIAVQIRREAGDR